MVPQPPHNLAVLLVPHHQHAVPSHRVRHPHPHPHAQYHARHHRLVRLFRRPLAPQRGFLQLVENYGVVRAPRDHQRNALEAGGVHRGHDSLVEPRHVTGSLGFAISARNAMQHDRALEVRFPRNTHIETPGNENSVGTRERQRGDLAAMACQKGLRLGRGSKNRVVGRPHKTPLLDAGDGMDGSLEILAACAGEGGEFVPKQLVVGGAGDEMAVRVHGEAGHGGAVAFQDPKRRRTPRIGIDSVRREQKNGGSGEGDGEERASRVEADVGNADRLVQAEASLERVLLAAGGSFRGVERTQHRGSLRVEAEQIVNGEERIHARQNRVDALLDGRFVRRRCCREGSQFV